MAKIITYNGNDTVLPDDPMTLPTGQKVMPVTAAEQVVTNAETGEKLPDTLENLSAKTVGGYWFDKTDADGNPTDEIYIHWYEDENGNVVSAIPIT